ncbi:MAG: hypothetical protein M1833_007063 [Piccolia ochrophora]|nr:MAG: hypothetical protein M1833_007063 [Piccolia ochrophora]
MPPFSSSAHHLEEVLINDAKDQHGVLSRVDPETRRAARTMQLDVAKGKAMEHDEDDDEDTLLDVRYNRFSGQVEVYAALPMTTDANRAARKTARVWQAVPAIPTAISQHGHRRSTSGESVSDDEQRSRSSAASDRARALYWLRDRSHSRKDANPPSRVLRPRPARSQRDIQSVESELFVRENGIEAGHESEGINESGHEDEADTDDENSDKDRGRTSMAPANPSHQASKTDAEVMREYRLNKQQKGRKKGGPLFPRCDPDPSLLFPANQPPPKLYATAHEIRKQGFRSIIGDENKRIDRSHDPGATSFLDRHNHRFINRTTSAPTKPQAPTRSIQDRLRIAERVKSPMDHGQNLANHELGARAADVMETVEVGFPSMDGGWSHRLGEARSASGQFEPSQIITTPSNPPPVSKKKDDWRDSEYFSHYTEMENPLAKFL